MCSLHVLVCSELRLLVAGKGICNMRHSDPNMRNEVALCTTTKGGGVHAGAAAPLDTLRAKGGVRGRRRASSAHGGASTVVVAL